MKKEKKTRRPGGGRKSLGVEPLVDVGITIPVSLQEKARIIGDNNVSAGIRTALKAFRVR